MMKRLFGCLTLVFAVGTLAAADKEVKILKEWAGKFEKEKDEPLMKEAPKSGFIDDSKAWEKLWKAWRPDEELPKIDFTKQMVMVGTVQAAGNRLFTGGFQLSEKGDLKGVFASTLMAGPGFAYKMLLIDREGVKTVNGKAMGKE